MLSLFIAQLYLHDDVIDNSSVRRGKKTSNIIWGNQPSILVGDYFLSRCFEIMVDVGSLEILKLIIKCICRNCSR